MSFVYIICPVTADPIYRKKRGILEAVALELGIDLRFPLDAPTLPAIGDTLQAIQECDVVVADLSLERPSCYFEVGVARAMKKPIFAICNLASSVHQGIDVSSLETFGTLTEFESAANRALTNAANKARHSNPH